LTQDFQDILLEFGQFVQKKNAIVGEADFPGFRDLSSSNQARIGYRVVRTSKRSGHDEGAVGWDQPHYAVDLCGFKALLKIHIRQNRWEPFGEHGFSGTRRADHDDIVPAGRGHFQTTLHVLLALHIVEINRIIHLCPKDIVEIHFHGIDP